jgi:iron complex transport system ATP-binding protein
MSFAATTLGFRYGLREVSFELPPAGMVAVTGPNGAGKSTLLGILGGLRRPYTGSAKFEGREIGEWPRRDFARRVAFVPQLMRVEFPFTAEEVVLMGRAPFAQGWFESREDHAAALHAMEITDTLAFRTRDVRSLSGGERQRVILAAALAQQPRTLLLDEPATFLDLRHQIELHRLLAELAKTMLVLAVTHDLNVALQFADLALVLDAGRLAAQGPPRDALNTSLVNEVFGVQAFLQPDPAGRIWLRYESGPR